MLSQVGGLDARVRAVVALVVLLLVVHEAHVLREVRHVFPTLEANFPVRPESKSTGLLAIEQQENLSIFHPLPTLLLLRIRIRQNRFRSRFASQYRYGTVLGKIEIQHSLSKIRDLVGLSAFLVFLFYRVGYRSQDQVFSHNFPTFSP